MSINNKYFVIFLMLSMTFFCLALYFIIKDLTIILEYLILSLQSSLMIMVILLDWMSLLFLSFVLFISSMVIYYSKEYMSGDLSMNRFILLVVMFVISMMLLIISPNLISILLGWDGLGLVSYCLVIYYQNLKSYNAGMITALTNRLGDVAFLISIAWFLNFGSWNFVFYLEVMKNDLIMQLITWLMLLAAMTKSAQIPFSSWLPAAMAAPTPVSSLVHSSTLVTAGVYLMIRFSYSLDSNMKLFLIFIASLTMFMSGLGANFEYDLKKIIALSTLSQLGLMLSILGLGENKLAFFHLMTHALFKALLFMCAGNMIHNFNNSQDIRNMGSLVNQMPLTIAYFNVSNLSLCGLPFLSGFYSKDLIVEVMSMNYLNLYIYIIFYISIGLTVCYSFRVSYYLLMGTFNFSSLNCLNEKNFIMLKSMSSLIIMVILSGSLLSWLIFSSLYFICLPIYMKLMTLILILSGIWLGLEISQIYLSSMFMLSIKISSFLGGMWNMPLISTMGINLWILMLSKKFTSILDLGWLEFFGAQNLKNMLKMSSNFNQILFNNNLKIYLMIMMFWISLLLFLF
uniref:NADH-ubiquinone oxidoreductase chain 5 n=1 Tax=Idgia oculata TaxID=1404354 RepID=A0A5J6CEF7_9CUCU|nr:NADH dehydrogenase subunit 5 [Idgia oculata]QEQ14407.1 NADH dehydrogenase subunit 5 [Idgia oculata]